MSQQLRPLMRFRYNFDWRNLTLGIRSTIIRRSAYRGFSVHQISLNSVALIFFCVTGAFLLAPASASADLDRLNTWQISCGVDKGSYSKKGRTHTFKTSSNHCPGGTFKQRAEINSNSIPPTTRGTFEFSTTISMATQSKNRFDLFQIADKRFGCAPPLKVGVLEDGRLAFDSAYKIGTAPGDNCRANKLLAGRQSADRLKRDGSPQKLKVIADFDGTGGFRVWVFLNGNAQISGEYRTPDTNQFFQSERFYFKHGVYSKKVFPYVMTSSGMRVRKVKVN